jgi:hypothetical protein
VHLTTNAQSNSEVIIVEFNGEVNDAMVAFALLLQQSLCNSLVLTGSFKLIIV